MLSSPDSFQWKRGLGQWEVARSLDMISFKRSGLITYSLPLHGGKHLKMNFFRFESSLILILMDTNFP